MCAWNRGENSSLCPVPCVGKWLLNHIRPKHFDYKIWRWTTWMINFVNWFSLLQTNNSRQRLVWEKMGNKPNSIQAPCRWIPQSPSQMENFGVSCNVVMAGRNIINVITAILECSSWNHIQPLCFFLRFRQWRSFWFSCKQLLDHMFV